MDVRAAFQAPPSYAVATEVYQGPLDLLLQLIERAELDITQVALAEVTGPFLDYVRQLQHQQAEEVSNFLVMAARLMQIKSEALLPRPVEREPGEEDPAEELLQQLILYKRYKQIADILRDRESQNLRAYLRLAPPPKAPGKLDMEGIELRHLVAAATKVYELAAAYQPSVNSIINRPTVTVKDKINQITQAIRKGAKSSFKKLLGKNPDRSEVVVTFLAMLELIKQYRIRANQAELFGDIEIEAEEDWENGAEVELEFAE